MSIRETGEFTLGLKSLELQLQTLLSNAGGEKATKLLDIMCKLKNSEQELILAMFSKVVKEIIAGDTRLDEMAYGDLKNFEESLYQDIIAEIEKTSLTKEEMTRRRVSKLQVLQGGSKDSEKKQGKLRPIISIDSLKNKKNESGDTFH